MWVLEIAASRVHSWQITTELKYRKQHFIQIKKMKIKKLRNEAYMNASVDILGLEKYVIASYMNVCEQSSIYMQNVYVNAL